MPVTSPIVQLGLYALEIRQDGAPVASDIQPWADVDDLRTGTASDRPFATWEPDFWLLDGEYKFLPDDGSTQHVGLMSLSASGADGAFTTPPTLTVTFGRTYSIPGLALRFNEYTGDFCDDLTVAYYDGADVLIRTDDYTPDAPVWSTEQAADDFKKVVITFRGTNRPYRHLRLTGIEYGELLTLDGTAIKAAQAVEEVDQLSAEVRVGTVELRLHSTDTQFNILDPSGYYEALAQRQPLWVFEQVDAVKRFIGQYYLDRWENKSPTEIELNCTDRLGVLDQQTYRGGLWSGVTLDTLLASMLGDVAAYELDATLTGITFSGWLPICTYREALQQLAFAVGASVSCTRSGVVKIRPSLLAATATPTITIPRAQQGMGGSLSLIPPITGVEVTGHAYTATTTTQQLYSGALPAGTHEIRFSQPMHTLSATGATIAESGANYAVLTVASPGTVTLSGRTYAETTRMAAVYAPAQDGLVENILRVTDATLVTTDGAADVAQRLYDYHQARYQVKLRLFAPDVVVGDVVIVETAYGGQVRGVIDKMDSNLAMGFVSKVELTGVKQ